MRFSTLSGKDIFHIEQAVSALFAGVCHARPNNEPFTKYKGKILLFNDYGVLFILFEDAAQQAYDKTWSEEFPFYWKDIDNNDRMEFVEAENLGGGINDNILKIDGFSGRDLIRIIGERIYQLLIFAYFGAVWCDHELSTKDNVSTMTFHVNKDDEDTDEVSTVILHDVNEDEDE